MSKYSTDRPLLRMPEPVRVVKAPEPSVDTKAVRGIVDAVMDAIEELNRTVGTVASVMNAVLQNTESVKQFVAKSNETGWLNTNSMQKALQLNEKAIAAIQNSIDANSIATRKYLESASKGIVDISGSNSSAMQKTIAQLNSVQSISSYAVKAVESAGLVVQSNRDFMNTVKKSIDDAGKNTSQLISAVKGIESAILETKDTMKLVGHAVQLVMDKLRDEKQPILPPDTGWNRVRVSVTGRDYKGQITDLQIQKE